MSDECILAIDQSTSASKAVIFDTQGTALAKASVPVRSLYPEPGYVEQDPVEIVKSVYTAVEQCCSSLKNQKGIHPGSIRCCGISNQRETFVVWDGKGEPLHNAIVWQCKRSSGICERLKTAGLDGMVNEKTGLIIDPYFSGTKLIWLVENSSPVAGAIKRGDAYFGTIDSWLLYNLTKGKEYRADLTNACRTLLFHIGTLDWDRELIRLFGLDGIRLPEPARSSGVFGETDFNGCLPKAIPVLAMIGDSHSSAFGHGIHSRGMVKVTMGTGSSILMNTGAEMKRSSSGMMTTLCWSAGDRVDYALEGVIVSCASTLNWVKEQLGLFSSYDDLERIAYSIEDTGGVYVLPAFSGMGAPHWKMNARGVIGGLTLGTPASHIIRAAMESISYQIADVIRAMEKDSGIPIREISADGGTARNAFIMQLCADVIGKKAAVKTIDEISAFGAACLAGLQSGIFKSNEDIVSKVKNSRTYFPSENTSRALEAYATWEREVLRL